MEINISDEVFESTKKALLCYRNLLKGKVSDAKKLHHPLKAETVAWYEALLENAEYTLSVWQTIEQKTGE